MLVPVHETSQNVRDLIIGAYMAAAEAAASVAVAAQEEIAFAGERTEKIHLAANDVAAELERVLAAGPGKGVVVVVASLRNKVGPKISCVFDLGVVASDQSDAPEEGCIAIDNAELGAQITGIKRRNKAVLGPNIADARFVHKGRIDGVGPPDGSPNGVVEVCARAEARG